MQARSAFRNHTCKSVRVRGGYLKGAAALSCACLISKIIGAAYRIPLVAVLGGKGLGLYQLAFPLYTMFLTFTSSGIAVGMARFISSGGSVRLKRAFITYGALGIVAALAMFLLAPLYQLAYGEEGLSLCCRLLSPSVFFVALISVVRGYFQGKGDMYPTALSEVSEQIIKVVLGVSLAGAFPHGGYFSVCAAVFAVTLSEAATCALVLWFYFTQKKRRPLYFCPCASYFRVLMCSVPLTLSAAASPLSALAESFFAVRLLRLAGEDGATLYGLFSGCALSLIGLSSSIISAIATSAVPHISKRYSSGDSNGAIAVAGRAIFLSFLTSLIMAVGLYFLSPFAVKIIFPSLSALNKRLLVRLIRTMCVGAIFSGISQTSSSALSSLGKPYLSASTQWFSSFLRVGVTSALIAFSSASILSAAISFNVCNFVAGFINLCYIISIKRYGKFRKSEDNYVVDIGRVGRKGRGYKRFRA